MNERFIRNAELARCKADRIALALDQPGSFQRHDLAMQFNAVGSLDFLQVNAIELAQPEEQLFLQSFRVCHRLQPLDRAPVRSADGFHIPRRGVRIRPAAASSPSMKDCTPKLIRLTPAADQAIAFSAVTVSGSASSVTSRHWQENVARIASSMPRKSSGSSRLGVPPPI